MVIILDVIQKQKKCVRTTEKFKKFYWKTNIEDKVSTSDKIGNTQEP